MRHNIANGMPHMDSILNDHNLFEQIKRVLH